MSRTATALLLSLLVTLPLSAGTRTWTGSQSGEWSNPANWSPQGVPTASDSLKFPEGAPHLVMNNDLPPGTAVGAMSFEGNGSLSGNPLTLTGNISFGSDPAAVNFALGVDVILGNSITIYSAFGKSFNGAIDVNGKTLTFDFAYNTAIRGPLLGSGDVVIIGTGLNLYGSGTFSGTIDGRVNIVGDYPQAKVRTPRFSGSGTVSAVHAGLLYPGDAPPLPSGGEHEIATIATGDLTIDPVGAKENGGAYNSMPKGRLLVDLAANGPSDQLVVHGTVSLDAMLEVTLLGAPRNGQTFTIIDNDGSDAVSGRFTDLSEGAMFTVGSTTLWISYRGGDGNDVVIGTGTPPPATKTWTGAVSANWSDPANWSPVGVPAPGDGLLFPAGARLVTNNDLSNFVAGPLVFKDDYVLNGNEIALTGDLLFDNSNAHFVCNAPLTLRKSLRFQRAASSEFNGAINAGNYVLTIDTRKTVIRGPISGTSEIIAEGEGLSVRGNGPLSGRFRGRTDIVGSYPHAVLDGLLGSISGSGEFDSIASLTLSPGSSDPCCSFSREVGTMKMGYLAINTVYFVDIDATGNDLLRSFGSVNLFGRLEVAINAPLTQPSYTIIENNSPSAVYGTFSGLPEGATFYSGATKFRISYIGGDGNDVVITPLNGIVKKPTSIALTQSSSTSFVSESVTFSATVSAASGVPTGEVTFTEGSSVLGSALLQNGTATLSTSSLAAGSHSITARYGGSAEFDSSTSPSVAHEVTKKPALLAITANPEVVIEGVAVSFRVAVTAQNDAQVPTGGVALTIDGAIAGSGTLNAGAISIVVASLSAGAHVVAATYAGDDVFTSASSSINLSVTKPVPVRSATTITLAQNRIVTEALQPVTFTATVSASSGVPDGSVTFRDGGVAIGTASLHNGAADFTTKDLAPGVHAITAAYEGSAAFEPSVSAVLEHSTIRGAASVQITSLTGPLVSGDVGRYEIRVTAPSSTETPSGNVALSVDGVAVTSGTLANATVTLSTPPLSAGDHTISAAYGGSASLEPESSTLRERVAKSPTIVEITTNADLLVAGAPITLTVRVAAPNPSTLIGGSVALRLGVNALPSAPLVANVATAVVGPFEAGEYTISADYAGDADFEASTASIVLAVGAPVVSVDGQKFDEGNGTHLVPVQIQLTGSSPTPVVLKYETVDGTAVASEDYAPAQGTLVVPPGQTSATIAVQVLGDREPEPDETFSIELTDPVGARISRSTASIVIRNDEPMYREPLTSTFAAEDGTPLHATLYAPLGGSRWPVVLWIPGDQRYDAKSAEIAALPLTARGFAVVALEYRAAGTAPFPAQVHDLQSAVRHLRTHAAELGIDATKIAAMGVGAGGHLAALLGAGMSGTDAKIQAVVTWNAITDPSTLQSDGASCADWTTALTTLLGCAPAACPTTTAAAAVEAHAGADAAPMLLMHGGADCIVSAQQSQRLFEATQRIGARATLRIIDGAGHDGGVWESSEAMAEVMQYLEARFAPRPRSVRR